MYCRRSNSTLCCFACNIRHFPRSRSCTSCSTHCNPNRCCIGTLLLCYRCIVPLLPYIGCNSRSDNPCLTDKSLSKSTHRTSHCKFLRCFRYIGAFRLYTDCNFHRSKLWSNLPTIGCFGKCSLHSCDRRNFRQFGSHCPHCNCSSLLPNNHDHKSPRLPSHYPC